LRRPGKLDRLIKKEILIR
jgi:hypothetical protein